MASKISHMNYCSSCGEDFASVTAFDMHRVGKHDYLFSPEHPDGRRCLTPKEMLAREKPMRRDQNGRWRSPVGNRPAFWASAAGDA